MLRRHASTCGDLEDAAFTMDAHCSLNPDAPSSSRAPRAWTNFFEESRYPHATPTDVFDRVMPICAEWVFTPTY